MQICALKFTHTHARWHTHKCVHIHVHISVHKWRNNNNKRKTYGKRFLHVADLCVDVDTYISHSRPPKSVSHFNHLSKFSVISLQIPEISHISFVTVFSLFNIHGIISFSRKLDLQFLFSDLSQLLLSDCFPT